jgi:ATP/maltotriose-dependent transcriptional regulator MalT/DNA-binding SARP family transcriptional activator
MELLRVKGQRLTKLTPPQVGDIVVNDRLYHLAAESLQKPLTWVSAPAGSGKTKLVSGYLKQRKANILWYQIDGSDNDPASFFYFLGIAASDLVTKGKKFPYPLFTPEYTFGLNTFSQRFFEKISADISSSLTIVFDDYHLIEPASALHAALVQGITSLAGHINCVVISRTDPPAPYADLQVKRSLSLISGKDLNLTSAEIGDFLAHLHTPFDTALTQHIHQRTQGWMVGVLLLAELVSSDEYSMHDCSLMDRGNLYNYFSYIVANSGQPNLEKFLLSTCYLPRFSRSMAQSLSGLEESKALTGYLVSNHLFTTQYGGGTDYYQYHPLFAEFLVRRTGELYEQADVIAIKQKSAMLLIDSHLYRQAAELLIQTEGWEQLSLLILKQAQELLSQGRASLLNQWITALPEPLRQQDPWLLFWLGLSHYPFDMVTCRQHLVSALHLFMEQNIKDGSYLSWSKIVDTYVNALSGFGELNDWVDYFHSTLQNIGPYEDEPWAGYVANSMFTALNLNRLDDETLPYWQSTSHLLCSKTSDINLLIQNTFQQSIYATFNRSTQTLEDLLFRVNTLLNDSNLTPFNTLQLYLTKSILSLFARDNDEVFATYHKAISLAHKHSLHHFNSSIIVATVASALMSNDVDTAKRLQSENQPISPLMLPLDQEISAHISARILLADNNPEAALEYAKLDLQLTHSIGYKPPMVFSLLVTSQILLSLDQPDEAREHINRALSISENIQSKFYSYLSLYQLAFLELTHGDFQRGIEALATSLSIANKYHFMNVYTWHKPTDILLYTTALKYSIETDFVINAISTLNLANDTIPYHLEAWPWPVKIYTLRNSLIFKDGKSIETSSAANSRPIELLRAIIALGGHSVSESLIYDLLWPQSEADAAARSLTTTLHRLRKLLGKDIVTVLNHRVSINRTVCWVDSDALFELLNKTIDGINKRTTSVSDVVFTSRTIFDLYPERGAAIEDQPGWFISYHEQLRSRLFTYIDTVTSFLKDHREYDAATRLYDFALAIDPLVERYYQGAIETSILQSRYSDAIKRYYQCVAELKEGLGISPSPTTSQLFAKARAMADAHPGSPMIGTASHPS